MSVLTGRRVALIGGAAFLVMFVPNIVLTVAAVRTFSGLVVPNSYVASQDFDRARDAQIALGWETRIALEDGVLRLDISDRNGRVVRPAALAVTAGRPTTSQHDVALALEETPAGYAAAVALRPGNWRVEIVAAAADGTAFRQTRELHVRQ